MKKLVIVGTTYNHEKYIAQALEGFVMQQTDFPFEVVMADDCSTDNTAKILRAYADKYPDIIKPIFREKNLGCMENGIVTLSAIEAEYVAVCEGDDYWTDPLKLQKQVDFMDANPQCSICFHPVKFCYEYGSHPDMIVPSRALIPESYPIALLTIEHLVFDNMIPTLSVMYRWRFNGKEKFKDMVSKDILPGDYLIHLLHAQKGKIGYINQVMGNYRLTNSGLWGSTAFDVEKRYLTHGIEMLNFYLHLEKVIPEFNQLRGHAFVANEARTTFNIYLKNQKFAEMAKIMELCPDLFTDNMSNVSFANTVSSESKG